MGLWEQPVWTGENISKPVASRRGSRGKWDSAVFFCWHVLWEASQKQRCFLGLYESHKTERLFWIYYIETYNYIHLSEHHTYILYISINTYTQSNVVYFYPGFFPLTILIQAPKIPIMTCEKYTPRCVARRCRRPRFCAGRFIAAVRRCTKGTKRTKAGSLILRWSADEFTSCHPGFCCFCWFGSLLRGTLPSSKRKKANNILRIHLF